MRYRTIVADPPWPYDDGWRGWGLTVDKRRFLPYPAMTLDEIAALPVRDFIAPEGYLFMWTTSRHLESAFAVVREWTFCPKQTLTWCKPPRGQGIGGLFAPTTEFVIVAQRVGPSGKSHKRNSTGGRIDRSHFDWPRAAHSAKPDAFLDMVEQVSPGPYLELFARRNRLGWDTWGNEALEHVNLGGAA